MIQGDPQWHSWRRAGIGASDIAAIVGVCPYKTPYGIWLEKSGRSKGFAGNEFTRHGKSLEGHARKVYQEITGRLTPPACVSHPQIPIVRASLDGWNQDERFIVEIKCPIGMVTLKAALAGRVLDAHMVQVQYQMFAAEASSLDLFVYRGDLQATVPVLPNPKLQRGLIKAAVSFWDRHVLPDIPPPLTKRDVKVVDDPRVAELCAHIRQNLFTLSKHQLEFLKERVVKMAGHHKVRCGSVQISAVVRGGRVSFYKLTIGAAS